MFYGGVVDLFHFFVKRKRKKKSTQNGVVKVLTKTKTLSAYRMFCGTWL